MFVSYQSVCNRYGQAVAQMLNNARYFSVGRLGGSLVWLASWLAAREVMSLTLSPALLQLPSEA